MRYLSKQNTQGGYTLVELLIAITISAVILTLGFSAYRRTQERQLLHQRGETIAKTLFEAQKKAQIGDKDCSGVFLGFDVSGSSGGNTLTRQAECQSESGSPVQVTLPEITLDQSFTVRFRPLAEGMDITSPPGVTELSISYTSGSLTHSVMVREPGTIEYEGEQ